MSFNFTVSFSRRPAWQMKSSLQNRPRFQWKHLGDLLSLWYRFMVLTMCLYSSNEFLCCGCLKMTISKCHVGGVAVKSFPSTLWRMQTDFWVQGCPPPTQGRMTEKKSRILIAVNQWGKNWASNLPPLRKRHRASEPHQLSSGAVHTHRRTHWPIADSAGPAAELQPKYFTP